MLINRPSEVVATLGSGLYSGTAWNFGFFVQDDWRITPKLTLNLGLRYDFYSNFFARGEGGTPQAGLYNPAYQPGLPAAASTSPRPTSAASESSTPCITTIS